MQVRQMEVSRLNNRSVVYIVEDHGTLQDLVVQGSTTVNAIQQNYNGNVKQTILAQHQASKLAARFSGKSAPTGTSNHYMQTMIR